MRKQNLTAVDLERRKVLAAGSGLCLLGLLVALGLAPGRVWAAADRAAFEAKNLDDALKALGVLIPSSSSLVKLTAPEIAENGAVVPVTVESTLSRTEQIIILVDKNPTALSARFLIPEGTDGYITTRIRMAQTSTVVALVKADGKFYRVSQEVKVIAGGC